MGKSLAKQLDECREALAKANARADEAEAEAQSLRQQLKETVPAIKFNALVELSKSQDEQISELTRRNRYLEFYQINNVWHWQHDSHDFLNGLTVPVVIDPDHLRQLLCGVNSHSEAELTVKLEEVSKQRDDEIIQNDALNNELNQVKRKFSTALLHLACMVRFARQELSMLIYGGEFISAMAFVKEHPESLGEQHYQQCPDLLCKDDQLHQNQQGEH